jgi:hypothetical protein
MLMRSAIIEALPLLVQGAGIHCLPGRGRSLEPLPKSIN